MYVVEFIVCCCSNSADKVVNGQGKFEELIVYSKDIAASTAQLVAASRVKARARSERLVALKGASKKGTHLHMYLQLPWTYVHNNICNTHKCFDYIFDFQHFNLLTVYFSVHTYDVQL